MIDNIPYRFYTDPVADSASIYLEDFACTGEYFIVTMPSHMMSDPEEHKNGPFVTLVYSFNKMFEYTEKCLEYVFSDTEEEAEKLHDEMLDKWDNIHYSKPCEVVDAEVQGW